MFTSIPTGMEHREPSSRDWLVAERVCAVLEHPCKLVLKSQDKGHWVLTYAVDDICRMYVHCKQATTTACEEGDTAGDLDTELAAMQATMRETIADHPGSFVLPVATYCPNRNHSALGILCDRRHRRGEIFFWISDSSLPTDVRL